MDNALPVIARGSLRKGQLNGKTILITGGGGGIGYEAARSLLWLGARVAIAEIDARRGAAAVKGLQSEFGKGCVCFIQTDISKPRSVSRLCRKVLRQFGSVDVLLNNATVASIGAAHTVGVRNWDRSYGVNLRGPVLLLERLLPQMLQNKRGVVIFVPSSGAAPFMGAYEVFKTSQVELCNTLSGELEGSGVIAFSIGPGIVQTETANEAIKKIAPLYGKTVEEFYAMNEAVQISAEEAGAGFAAAIAMADRYNSEEISSIQALADAGIFTGIKNTAIADALPLGSQTAMLAAYLPVLETYRQQSDGWKNRNVFERQWILRDFKKVVGLSVDIAWENLASIEKCLQDNQQPAPQHRKLVSENIRKYYVHQREMLLSYEKDSVKAGENAHIIDRWIGEIDGFEETCRTIMDKNANKT